MLITLADAETSPVPLALLKEHMQVLHDDWDATLETYRDAAVAFVEEETTRILARKTLEYRIEDWPWRPLEWPWVRPTRAIGIELPASPVRDVRNVSYLDEDGQLQVLDEADWRFDRTSEGAIVTFVDGWDVPSLAFGRMGAVRVEFDAGYDAPEGGTGTGEDSDLKLPKTAVQVVLLLATHWHENRAAVAGAEKATTLPLGIQALIDKLRIWR